MPIDYTVTRRALTLGPQDATTGWYEKQYTPTDITLIGPRRRGSSHEGLPVGVFAKEDAVGITQDPIEVGDEIEDALGTFWEVVERKAHGEGDCFDFYEVQLHELPFHEA